MNYIQRVDGEGWTIVGGQAFKIACCDCGLVHRMVVTTENNEPLLLGIAARRENRSTGQRRRQMRERKEREARQNAAIEPELPLWEAPPAPTTPDDRHLQIVELF